MSHGHARRSGGAAQAGGAAKALHLQKPLAQTRARPAPARSAVTWRKPRNPTAGPRVTLGEPRGRSAAQPPRVRGAEDRRHRPPAAAAAAAAASAGRASLRGSLSPVLRLLPRSRPGRLPPRPPAPGSPPAQPRAPGGAGLRRTRDKLSSPGPPRRAPPQPAARAPAPSRPPPAPREEKGRGHADNRPTTGRTRAGRLGRGLQAGKKGPKGPQPAPRAPGTCRPPPTCAPPPPRLSRVPAGPNAWSRSSPQPRRPWPPTRRARGRGDPGRTPCVDAHGACSRRFRFRFRPRLREDGGGRGGPRRARVLPTAAVRLQPPRPESRRARSRYVPKTSLSSPPWPEVVLPDPAEETRHHAEVVGKVNELIATGQYGRLFAVVHFASHQWKVTSEDLILINNELDIACGERIRLEKVLLVGADNFTLLGKPLLGKDLVRVEATVIEKTESWPKINMKFKKRKKLQEDER
uniref:Large ribosomal subunit protein bL21m n=1 Tax=Canis lupus familiaris TaxID=9615 RepID=A0A8I3MY45_CANLF